MLHLLLPTALVWLGQAVKKTACLNNRIIEMNRVKYVKAGVMTM